MSRLHDMGGRYGDGPIQFPEIKTIRLKIVSLLSNMNGMQKLGL